MNLPLILIAGAAIFFVASSKSKSTKPLSKKDDDIAGPGGIPNDIPAKKVDVIKLHSAKFPGYDIINNKILIKNANQAIKYAFDKGYALSQGMYATFNKYWAVKCALGGPPTPMTSFIFFNSLVADLFDIKFTEVWTRNCVETGYYASEDNNLLKTFAKFDIKNMMALIFIYKENSNFYLDLFINYIKGFNKFQKESDPEKIGDVKKWVLEFYHVLMSRGLEKKYDFSKKIVEETKI